MAEKTRAEKLAREAAAKKAGEQKNVADIVVLKAESFVQRRLIIELVGEDKYWLLVEAVIRADQ
jgi:hypothetical protein